jgi:S-adenosylmethionine-diacylglycerol 3-amino-3-carboxypropyl transferase
MDDDMMNRTLLNNALFNSTTFGLKGIADQIFSVWYSRLAYTQVWEDAELDLRALNLEPGANIVTVASAGCNAIAYLSSSPAAVHAVDVNEAQLAVLDIKRQAIKHLVDHQSILAFLGKANSRDNRKRYQRHIRQHLSESAKHYWDSRTITGKPRYQIFCDEAYQHGLLGNAIGVAHWLVKCLGGDLDKFAQANTQAEQIRAFNRYIAPVFDHPVFKFFINQPYSLYGLGIPLSQYAKLKKEAHIKGKAGVHKLIKDRVRQLACHYGLNENCFAQQAFKRQYDSQSESGLPMYLQQQHYAKIRRNIDHIYPHHSTLTDFLRTQPKAAIHAFVLHDTQDWMDQRQMLLLWEQITRTAAPGAKVIFRTAGIQSPLEDNLPKSIQAKWKTDQEQNQRYHATDKSAIYGGFHLYQKA